MPNPVYLGCILRGSVIVDWLRKKLHECNREQNATNLAVLIMCGPRAICYAPTSDSRCPHASGGYGFLYNDRNFRPVRPFSSLSKHRLPFSSSYLAQNILLLIHFHHDSTQCSLSRCGGLYSLVPVYHHCSTSSWRDLATKPGCPTSRRDLAAR